MASPPPPSPGTPPPPPRLELVFDNPEPQLPPGGRSPHGNPVLLDVGGGRSSEWATQDDKIVILMVGLPARGKTYVARRVQRYFTFFHDATVRIFNIGDYRRSMSGNHHAATWFEADHAEGREARRLCTDAALRDLVDWVDAENDGRIAILDGTHSTLAKRQYVLDKLKPLKCKVIMIEALCSDEALIERNIRSCNVGTPDYEGMSPDAAVSDFRRRVGVYEETYESIDAESTLGAERSRSFIKMVDCRQCIINNIRGSVPSKLVHFLMDLHLEPHVFYLSRHGQSIYNATAKIGGDSGLSAEGDAYAKALAEFVDRDIVVDNEGVFGPAGAKVCARLWTSTMRRTRETARYIRHPVVSLRYADDDVEGRQQSWVQMRPRAWANLDELFAGVCDGMTYAEIEQHYPDEFQRRQKDKLGYRYPRGESYLDMIHRLDTIVHEMERHREPLLIVAHQGILRLLYAYYMGLPRERAPYVEFPLNTVIKLTPRVFETEEQRFLLRAPPTGAGDGQTEPTAGTGHSDPATACDPADPPSH
mmetsp:Transcript_21010/g.74709  ORF Transcript_21010/g.74709 Transcript_21010/m.74709 type:complete len:534 (-) Transcript_21010:38-1639(-)